MVVLFIQNVLLGFLSTCQLFSLIFVFFAGGASDFVFTGHTNEQWKWFMALAIEWDWKLEIVFPLECG
jgi:hypothetical protein